MRVNAADGRDAPVKWIVRRALKADGACLGHAISDSQLTLMHLGGHPLHHLDRTRRTRHDTGAQTSQVDVWELGMIENSDKHGRDTVQPGATLFLHGGQHRQWIES